jgi:hypothetical protein
MPDPKEVMRILITAKDGNTLRALLRGRELDLNCGGPKEREGGAFSIEAYVPEDRIDELRVPGVKIDILGDETATARERQKQVGKGNRFEGGVVPRGQGRKVKEGGGDVLP